MENEQQFSSGQLIKGIFAGLLIGAVCLVADFFIGLVFTDTHYMFFGSMVTAAALIVIAAVAIRRSRDRGFLRGMLISLSLAFIGCTICGVVLGPGPLRF